MTKNTIKEIIESYMESEVPEEVRMTFERWLLEKEDSGEKDAALNDVWDRLPLMPDVIPEDAMSIVAEAENIADAENIKRFRKKNILLWTMSAIAACMTIFAVLGWSLQRDNETCLISSATSKGEFHLPDGSTVWLNKGSELRYYNDLKGKNRKVVLEGEGYFDVVKDSDHPFIVEAGGMSVKVLGTCFTVSAYQGNPVEAFLEEGSILASVPNHTSVTLIPNQAVRYDVEDDSFISFDENASDHTTWIDGKLEFVNKSLLDIMECLEHWYCIDISCNDLNVASGIRLSMTIKQESIEEICSAISVIADVSCFIDSKGNVKISFGK